MKVLRSASGLSVIAMMALFISNYWVRPLADDYCLAAKVHTFGLFGAINDYFQTWSGDGALIFVLVTLVGMPISGLGTFGYAFISFTAMSSAVIFLFRNLLRGLGINRSKSTYVAILLFVSFFVTAQYSAILDKGYFADNYVTPKYFNLAINSWSTIVIQYLFLPTLCYLFFTKDIQESKAKLSKSLVIAFLIGTSGYTLAATFFILFFVRSKIRKENIAFPIFLACASLISFFSTGARARKKSIVFEQGDLTNFGEALRFFARQILKFVGLYLNFGTILIIIFAICVGFVLNIGANRAASVRKYFIDFSFFLVVSFGVNALAEFFTYTAFWHLVFIKLIVFLQVVMGTLYVFSRREQVREKSLYPQVFLALLVIFGVFLNVSEKVSNSIAWQNEIPIDSGIAERDSDWVERCWDALSR